MPRARRPLLSKERIVETALGLVDAEGLAALSTRRLAAELGVSGPSLYYHFRTKDEILDAVADAVSAQVDLSMLRGGRDWRGALHDWAVSYRRALGAHPHVVPLLARRPGRRPAALRLAEAVFRALVDAGWPPAQAGSVAASMRYFVMGAALGSLAGVPADRPDGPAPHGPAARPRPAGRPASLVERAGAVDDRAFASGLAALLDGLALQYPPAGAHGRDPLPRTGRQRGGPGGPPTAPSANAAS
ncbi:TetR family transcriptional regulator [Streptomyces sp. LE64]|uniref:TetR family transcriptional regulator n=1 Tax=Streptomyces sp. LE64 TaxID=3448653 RepID=UPI004042683F